MEHLLAVWLYLQTHVLSVVLALVASYVIGFTWHGPLFGKLWMKLNGMTPPKKGEMKFSMMLPGLAANFVLVVVQSAVLGRTFQIVNLPSATDALVVATILWLAFTALTIANSYAWMGKTFKHICLDAAHYLVSIWAIAAILYATL